MQFSVELRNARADQIEVIAGASPILRIRTGAPPANCAAANTGSVLADITLPANWANDAANGSKTMLGSWADNSADATGVAGHYRLYKADGVTCVQQGTVAQSGADLNVDNTNFQAGQQFSISQWTINEGNA